MAAEHSTDASAYQSDHDLLIRLDTKVDGMTAKLDKLTDDHEERIRALEMARWIVGGAASAIGIIGGYVFQLVV